LIRNEFALLCFTNSKNLNFLNLIESVARYEDKIYIPNDFKNLTLSFLKIPQSFNEFN